MNEVLERLERERADFLEREAKELRGEAAEFLIFARENCNFVALLSLVWQMLSQRLPRGGVPARPFVQECDQLLSLLAAPERVLSGLLQVWDDRGLPGELADPVHLDVQRSQNQVRSLLRDVMSMRDLVMQAPRGITADPAELKKRLKRADENSEWQPLWAAKQE